MNIEFENVEKLNELQLARSLKEMEDFTKELEVKIKNAQARRDALNIKGSWISNDYPIDFLIGYYVSIKHRSEEMIEKFLNDIELEKKRNILHSVLEESIQPSKMSEEVKVDVIPKRLKKLLELSETVPSLLMPECKKIIEDRADEVIGSWECGVCHIMQENVSINQFVAHVDKCPLPKDETPTELICGKCGKKDFKDARGFSKHVNSCEGGITVCSDCKNDFKTVRGLLKHKPKCKGPDIERYQCSKCTKWIPLSNKNLHQWYHIRKEKGSSKSKDTDTSIEVEPKIKKGGRVVCPGCKNSFARIYELNAHKCKGKGPTYLCPDCNRWIPVSKKKTHQKYHEYKTKDGVNKKNDGPKPVIHTEKISEDLKKVEDESNGVPKHIETPEVKEEKLDPSICDVCGSQQVSPQGVLIHKTKTHNKPKIKIDQFSRTRRNKKEYFECDIPGCEQSFSTAFLLSMHRREDHPINFSEVNK